MDHEPPLLYSRGQHAEALVAQDDGSPLSHLNSSRQLQFFQGSPHNFAGSPGQRCHFLLCQWQMTDGMVSAAGDRLFVTLGLFGFLLPMTLGMSARSLPMYAGLDAFPPRLLLSLTFTYLGGLLAFCVGISANWQEAEGAGMALIGGVLLSFVLAFLRTMRTRGELPHKVAQLASEPAARAHAYRARVLQERGSYGPFVALVASAYLWAVVSALFLLTNGLFELAGQVAPFADDAIRHGLTIGFISLLICGLAPRMLPGFSGGTIRSAKLVSATLWLGNLAALFRVGSLIFAPWLVIGSLNLARFAFCCSGILGLGLAICLACNLWPALRTPLSETWTFMDKAIITRFSCSFNQGSFTFCFQKARAALSRAVNSHVTRGTHQFKVCQQFEIPRSIQISVDDQTTFLAYKDPVSKRQIRMIPATARTRFRGWFPPGDDMDLHASLLSFVGELPAELRETNISNGAG